jgi:hypothetical protein
MEKVAGYGETSTNRVDAHSGRERDGAESIDHQTQLREPGARAGDHHGRRLEDHGARIALS